MPLLFRLPCAHVFELAALAPMHSQRVRELTREILSEPRFAPRGTLWQWLMAHVANWHVPSLGPWGQVLVWGVLIWSALTLAAIVAHTIWTLRALWGASKASHAGQAPALWRRQSVGVEQLEQDLQRYVAAGRYREALAIMMLLALRRLEAAGLVSLHESKTNGEYVREVPSGAPVRTSLKQLVQYFDRVVYGGGPCGPDQLERMRALMQQVVDDARPSL